MKRKSFLYPLIFAATAAFAIVLILFPQDTADAVRNALKLCASSVLPSLFPFFVVANLVTNLRFADIFGKVLDKVMKPLFSVRGSLSAALALGFVGGYPVGAVTCTSLYKARLCTKEEAERTLAFCNNCGPAFIIGAIGAGVFSSSRLGIALLLIHILAAVSVGLIFRTASPVRDEMVSFGKRALSSVPPFASAFTDAVFKALKSSLTISAYIVLFSVLVCVVRRLNLLPAISGLAAHISGAERTVVEATISGMLEMTVGAYSLSECADFEASFVITAFLLGWGGLSVHCQALSVLSETDLNTRQYFMGKLLHGLLSAVYAYASIKVFNLRAVPSSAISSFDISNQNPLIVFVIFFIFIFIFCKKGWKKIK